MLLDSIISLIEVIGYRDILCYFDQYENYLKCEEIKENYFKEIRYKGYAINPGISNEELDKLKIKNLVR